MEDPYVENIDRLGVSMFQTSDNTEKSTVNQYFSTEKIPRILNHKMVQGGDLILYLLTQN